MTAHPGRARRRAAVLVAAAIAAGGALAGCSGGELTWSRQTLPQGTVTALTAYKTGVLVGMETATGSLRPSLVAVGGDGTVTPVPVLATGPYAAQARWTSLATNGRTIVAVGDAHGGAHANDRWTVWRGDLTGVADEPQPFAVFHGWGAGAVTAAVLTGGGPMLVGSWENPDRPSMSLAIWRPGSQSWARVEPTPQAMTSSETDLPTPQAAATAGERVVVAGWTTDLSGDGVRARPVIWLGDPPPSAGTEWAWARYELPAADDNGGGEAQRLACSGSTCLVSGIDHERLALWWVQVPAESGAAPQSEELPPPPGLGGKTPSEAVPAVTTAGVGWLAWAGADQDRTRLASTDGRSWTPREAPSGIPQELAASTARLALVTRASTGATTLWTTSVR